MNTQHNDAMSMSIPAYQQKYNEISQSNIGKPAAGI